MAATSQVTGRHDLLREPSAPHRWWDTVDPTYPVHVDRDPTPAMGANESGKVGLVGFPVQKEWSGSWREFMAEAARPKPNTMSSLHYTMQQTETEYIMHVTHWKDLADQVHLDEATVHRYRPVAYVYITGPPRGRQLPARRPARRARREQRADHPAARRRPRKAAREGRAREVRRLRERVARAHDTEGTQSSGRADVGVH